MATSSNGHLEGDPQYYNFLAFQKVQDIKRNGMTEFEVHPEGQGPAGVASILYLMWNNPYAVVLLNAALHASSFVVMVLILREWFPLKTSILGALPLALSPYLMFWFSQINKDTFALIGALLFTLGLLRLTIHKNLFLTRKLFFLLVAVSGIALIWLVRPYLNQMLLPVTAVILFVAFLQKIQLRVRWQELISFVMCALLLCASLAILGQGAASNDTLDSFDNFKPILRVNAQTVAARCDAMIEKEQWLDEPLMPDFVNRKLKAIAGHRCRIFILLESQTNAAALKAVVDRDRLLDGSLKTLSYIPRAALLGIFAPWPTDWSSIFSTPRSVFYTITSIEAGMMYAGLAALAVWSFRSRRRDIFIPLALAASVMTVYGMATPFLGALYRYRFPWWMLTICIGLAALIEICRWNRKWSGEPERVS
ncbi:hypothetical protein [Polaromonas sp.]|uniref:hypothetical protein n=1 Tax=Polaromonas sp. TaxID=1869339 RepID=UPI003263BD4F